MAADKHYKQNKQDASADDPAAPKDENELQARFDEMEEKGYMGVKVDPTPNERYSLESDDWATPESDPEAAAKVGSQRFAGSASKDQK